MIVAPTPCITVPQVKPRRPPRFQHPPALIEYRDDIGDIVLQGGFEADLISYAIISKAILLSKAAK